MSNQIINTRLQLKYDTYANWTSNNPVLLSGEVAIVVVPASAGAVAQEPAVLMKVGDGTSNFNALSFTGAIAADVYDWAKATTKPSYAASEITGLSDYISSEIEDTDTQYKIEADATDGHKFYLYAKDIDGEYAIQNTITIPETVYTLVEGSTNGTVAFNGTDVAVHGLGTAAYTASTAYDASGSAAQALVDAKTYADGLATNYDASGAAATALADAKTYADGIGEDIEAIIGTVEDGATIVEMIEAAEEAATYDDTALAGRVSTIEADYLTASDKTELAEDIATNTAAITVLNGTGEGSVSNTVATAIAGIVADADTSFDTLKEIADWILSDTTGAAAMQSDISDNADAIEALEALVGDTAVATQIATAITAALKVEGVDKYALATDLTALASRVTALETDSHTHANKTVLDGITAAKVTAWDAAEQNAKDYADGIVGDLDDELADIAKTGNVADLIQTADTYIVFNCGSSSVNI